MPSFLDKPWEGRRSIFVSQDTNPAAVIREQDAEATNYAYPVFGQKRDGNYIQGVPFKYVYAVLANNPVVGQLTIKIGTDWAGTFDLDQQPQVGIAYTIEFDQVAPNSTITTISRSFTVTTNSHPSNTWNNADPFRYYYIDEIFPWLTPSGAYEYNNFRVGSVTYPPYYNP